MATSVKVGSFNVGTGTGNVSVTGVGFQPKAVLFYATRQATAGQGAHLQLNFGAATSATQRWSMSAVCQDAQATTQAVSYASQVACLSVIANDGFSVESLLDFVSLDADGFTVVPDDAFPIDQLISYVALGGDDLTNAYAGTLALTSGTGTVAVTGVGFQPDCLIGAMTTAASWATRVANAGMTVGFAISSTSRACWGMGSQDNVATTNSWAMVRNARWLTSFGDGTEGVVLDLTTMDADGFTYNKVSHASGGTERIGYLALKGGNFAVGTVAAQTGTGTWATTGLGFKPSGLLLGGTFQTTATQTSPAAEAEFGFGAASGTTARAAIWAIDPDALADSDNQNRHDTSNLLVNYATATGFAVEGTIDLSSFDSDGFTLDQTDADGSAWLLPYLAIGPGASAATGNHKLAGKLFGKLSGKV